MNVKPKYNLKNLMAGFWAITTGKKVPEAQVRRRFEICLGCKLIGSDGHGGYRCSICTCKLKGSSNIINLASYEETKLYGCKHPSGSRWEKADV